MSSQASVLFDAPGPLARRRILIANLIALAAVLALAVVVLMRMADADQLEARRWTAALDANASDECEVVELTDETLYMNMRSRQGKKQRAYAFSQVTDQRTQGLVLGLLLYYAQSRQEL